ncbi:MAG: hypothetical protein R3C05_05275 [Pirellulaceae bacterium]
MPQGAFVSIDGDYNLLFPVDANGSQWTLAGDWSSIGNATVGATRGSLTMRGNGHITGTVVMTGNSSLKLFENWVIGGSISSDESTVQFSDWRGTKRLQCYRRIGPGNDPAHMDVDWANHAVHHRRSCKATLRWRNFESKSITKSGGDVSLSGTLSNIGTVIDLKTRCIRSRCVRSHQSSGERFREAANLGLMLSLDRFRPSR